MKLITEATTHSILDVLREYLATALGGGTLALIRRGRDGRIDSQENERQISHALQLFSISNESFRRAGLGLEVAPPRHWFDFSIRGEGLFLPVNVKVSALKTSDNLSSKEGLFYALTGVNPQTLSINDWERFCEQLAANSGSDQKADYYFLVVNKRHPGDVFWTSLKRIPELVPNGNNPPFQCNWSRNRIRCERTEKDARDYILGILRETFVLRARALASFDRHLKPLMS